MLEAPFSSKDKGVLVLAQVQIQVFQFNKQDLKCYQRSKSQHILYSLICQFNSIITLRRLVYNP